MLGESGDDTLTICGVVITLREPYTTSRAAYFFWLKPFLPLSIVVMYT
jgi:hypothetical protein